MTLRKLTFCTSMLALTACTPSPPPCKSEQTVGMLSKLLSQAIFKQPSPLIEEDNFRVYDRESFKDAIKLSKFRPTSEDKNIERTSCVAEMELQITEPGLFEDFIKKSEGLRAIGGQTYDFADGMSSSGRKLFDGRNHLNLVVSYAVQRVDDGIIVEVNPLNDYDAAVFQAMVLREHNDDPYTADELVKSINEDYTQLNDRFIKTFSLKSKLGDEIGNLKTWMSDVFTAKKIDDQYVMISGSTARAFSGLDRPDGAVIIVNVKTGKIFVSYTFYKDDRPSYKTAYADDGMEAWAAYVSNQ